MKSSLENQNSSNRFKKIERLLKSYLKSCKEMSLKFIILQKTLPYDASLDEIENLKKQKDSALKQLLKHEWHWEVPLNLRKANLENMNLQGINLSYTDLSGVKLCGANLTNSNLMCAKLCDADLSGSDLKGLDLIGANLINVDLTNTDLRYSNMTRAKLHGAKMHQTNLSEVDLTDVDLRSIKMGWINLSEAKLKECLLPLFIEADLGKVNVNEIRLGYSNPPEAQNSRGILVLGIPPKWNVDLLNQYLSNMNNERGSLLKTIDSIDCNKTKARLAGELIESLKNNDVSTVALPLLSMLNKPPYIEHDEIADYQNVLSGLLDTIWGLEHGFDKERQSLANEIAQLANEISDLENEITDWLNKVAKKSKATLEIYQLAHLLSSKKFSVLANLLLSNRIHLFW
ncbi:hypothetical protein BJP44_04700 [Candidatus Williamhamiltonella defendens]|uniref:Pentapeptide repeat-containing protein n=2 Tax=Candidatus Williamhamiltonella defendens TaxID=138072 RepID=C4K580_HAMD5|nr:pentapeptide repeat-containing protein [Candidatus Hamiltonella defensa 5AT (Acyrthosiphon pisum)]ATW22415.1 hypothetical protein BJP44_04700 [Candidatus Hamiltonella defensa]